jgi:hypothetical protein
MVFPYLKCFLIIKVWYHNGLEYLFDQTTLNPTQSRWLEFLCECDIDIKHIKGKENKVVDALNKRVNELHDTTLACIKLILKV